MSDSHTLLTKFTTRNQPAAAIAPPDRRVIKRDGTTVPWDADKMTRAIALAYYEVRHQTTNNPYRDDAAAHYGLDLDTFLKAQAITRRAAGRGGLDDIYFTIQGDENVGRRVLEALPFTY